MKLTANFTLEEFLANPHGIELHPTDEEIEAMRRVCVELLEPVRAQFRTPIQITSGFRNAELLAKLKELGYPASPVSQHLKGEAADFLFPHKQDVLYAAFGWIKVGIPQYGQNIFYYRPGHPMQEAIHLSLGRKHENLIQFKGVYHKAETFGFWT